MTPVANLFFLVSQVEIFTASCVHHQLSQLQALSNNINLLQYYAILWKIDVIVLPGYTLSLSISEFHLVNVLFFVLFGLYVHVTALQVNSPFHLILTVHYSLNSNNIIYN